MDSFRFDRLTRSIASLQTRRGAVRALLGAGALGLLSVAMTNAPAAAVKSLSACKNRCNTVEGQCQSDCRACCEKVLGGKQQRCDFGCGVVQAKKKKRKKKKK